MKKYVTWVGRNVQGIRLNMAGRVGMGILQTGLGLAQVAVCKRFIDVTIRTGTDRDVVAGVVLLAGIILGGIVLRLTGYAMTIRARTRLVNGMKLRLFGLLMHRKLYGGKMMHSGDLVSRLEKDIDLVSDTVAALLPDMAVTCCKLGGAFLMLYALDSRLAWTLLLLTPPFLILGKLTARKLRSLTHDIRSQESLIQMTVQEGLEHNDVIRAMGSTGWIMAQVKDMQRGLEAKVDRRTRFTVMARTVISSGFGLGYLLVFVWGGLMMRSGEITMGTMIAFLQLAGQVQHPMLNLLNGVPQLIHTMAGVDRLAELEQLPAETADTQSRPAKEEAATAPWGIRVSDVTFGYGDEGATVMKGFSHDFRPGTHTAVMGHTGVGKTTLFRLLLGLAEPQTGSITIYNEEGKTLEVNAGTRYYMTYIPQGNSLMSGTIRYNLLVARPDATDEMLRRALHTAVADFVFDLADGMDTIVGERGCGLSEGQAQRIAIARGLLLTGSILLLDEISSALDESTERELFGRIFKACPQKTILLITHRPEVAEICDGKIFLDARS